MSNPASLTTAVLTALVLGAGLRAQDRVHGHLINFQDNGAWSWFEDERAIVDPFRGRIVVGSCADNGGRGGSSRGGDIDVAWLDVSAGRFGRFELHDRLQGDDHNSPALLVLPDGRYIAMYGMHGGSGSAPLYSRWRVSSRPGDPTAWSTESTFLHSRAMSYSNLHHLSATGHTYNFVRATNFDPNVMVSSDLGKTWSGTGKLLTEGGNSNRPYLKYASDGRSRIHLLTTERHPRDYDNSIYHGYVEKDALRDSFGNLIDANILDASGRPPAALTPIFKTGTSFGGVVMRRAWTIDLAADGGSVIRALFQARALDRDTDHRLFFARFDGKAWSVHEVCRLGGYLYARENDYTGLAALHPDRPDTVYVSTRVDPRNNVALGKYEIFAATTTNLGAAWTFTPVTENSSVDNVRPIVPAWDGNRTAVLWLRGAYRTYTDFDTAVVGRIEAPELEFGKLIYHDATTANTTRHDGSAANPTGPAAGQGATDDRWHLRTGFGNGGTVWTSSEQGGEDTPMLRTRLTGLTPGAHDVFLQFWSNPNEDWGVRAGFVGNALRNFEKQGAAAAEPNHFAIPPVTVGSTVRLYSIWLGRATVGATGTLDTYVDDYGRTQSSRERSWFDGIAVAPVAGRASRKLVGTGCNGSQELALSAEPRLGTTVGLTMTRGLPGAMAAAVAGDGALRPIDLGTAGFPGCVLMVLGLVTVPLGVIDAGGNSVSLPIKIPLDPTLRGLRFGLQGGTFRNGMQLTPALLLLPGS